MEHYRHFRNLAFLYTVWARNARVRGFDNRGYLAAALIYHAAAMRELRAVRG